MVRPSGSRHNHPVDAQAGGVDAVFEGEVIGGDDGLPHLGDVSGDGHLTDRVSNLPFFDPEAARAAAVVAGDNVGAAADGLRDEEALIDVLDQVIE